MYKDIFREVGILTMLSTALKEYASQLKEDRTGVSVCVCVRERRQRGERGRKGVGGNREGGGGMRGLERVGERGWEGIGERGY